MSACVGGGSHQIVEDKEGGRWVCVRCEAYWIPVSGDLIVQEVGREVGERKAST